MIYYIGNQRNFQTFWEQLRFIYKDLPRFNRRAIRHLNSAKDPLNIRGIVFSFGDSVILGPNTDNKILNYIDVYNRGVEIYGEEYFLDKIKKEQLEKTKKEENKIIKYSRFSIMEID